MIVFSVSWAVFQEMMYVHEIEALEVLICRVQKRGMTVMMSV
jgi:hypothetical protein